MELIYSVMAFAAAVICAYYFNQFMDTKKRKDDERDM